MQLSPIVSLLASLALISVGCSDHDRSSTAHGQTNAKSSAPVLRGEAATAPGPSSSSATLEPAAEAGALPERTAEDHATAATYAADDAGRNLREDGTQPTPLDQGSSETDIAISQSIRRAIVARDDLSMNAKNIKIITRESVVTLRGPVSDIREKEALLAAVQSVSGIQRVDDRLDLIEP